MTKATRSLCPLTYSSWKSMNCRVSTKPPGYENVKICERWRSFHAFLEDMGKRPSISMTLDRIDPAGDYEPSNCRWASWKQQNSNKRTFERVTVNGRSLTIAEWAKETGIAKATIHARIFNGWKKEDAVTTPASERAVKTQRRKSVEQILEEHARTPTEAMESWTRDQCIALLARTAVERDCDWKGLADSIGMSSAYMSQIVKGRKRSLPKSVLDALGLKQQVMYVKNEQAIKPAREE